MSRFPKPYFFLLLPTLAPLAHAELISSYDTNNLGAYFPLISTEWSDSVEQPTPIQASATLVKVTGYLVYEGWGTTIDPEKYVGFKVTTKPGHRINLKSLEGISTWSNKIPGTEMTSFVWAFRVDDDKDGVFERDWTFGRTYTSADGDNFTSTNKKDWGLPLGLSTKGTIEFGLFATAADTQRQLRVFTAKLDLHGTSTPIGPLDHYRYVASYDIDVSEASAVAYNWDKDTLFSVGDEGEKIVEFTKTGQKVSEMFFDKSGTLDALDDPEGLNYLGGGEFLVGAERAGAAIVINYNPEIIPTYADLLPHTYSLGIGNGNLGLEGVAYDPINDSIWGVRENGPAEIREIPNFTAVRAGEPYLVQYPVEQKMVTRICDQLSDIYMLAQCPHFPADHPRRKNFLLLNRGGKRVLEMTRSGKVTGVLDLAFLNLETIEGLTMDNDGNIYLVSEQVSGRGDSSLHVFAPGPETPQPATPQQAFAMETLSESFEELGLDPALVFGSQKMVAAIDGARQQGRTDIIANPQNYDLFTETSIQDLRGTGVLIRVEGDEVNLSLPIQTSETIAEGLWEDAGVQMKATLPKIADKAFYRFTLPQN